MSNEKHEVHFAEAERKKLLAIISKGRNKAVAIQRAHILLKVDEGKIDTEIGETWYVSEQTILWLSALENRRLTGSWLDWNFITHRNMLPG